VLVGLAALTRAELILLSLVLVVPLCLLTRGLVVRRRLALLLVAGVAVTATIAPWCAYNLSRYERPVYVTSGLDLALLVSNCDATYRGDTKGWWSYRCYLAAPRPPGDESQQAVVYGRLARDYIGAHRGELPGVVLARVGRVWAVYDPGGQLVLDTIETRELPASRAGLAMFYVLAALTPVGLVRLSRRGQPVLPLVSLLVVVTAAAALVYGTTRFRASAEVSLVVAAAVAVAAPRTTGTGTAGTDAAPLSGRGRGPGRRAHGRSGAPDTTSPAAAGTPPPAADNAPGPRGSDLPSVR
jgi:peptidoglycan/LPS O-acetylase OafA/YrhL